MAKIILLYVVALLMIFPLFWNHGNAITPRKLGTRYNAVTNLPNTNKVIFRGSVGRYSLDSGSSVHANAENTPRILGARHNAVTRLPNTKEATFDGSGHQYFTISSSSADHANADTPRILGARYNVVTSETTSAGSEHQDSHIPNLPTQTGVETHYFHRFSPSQMWQPVQFEVTHRKLWSSRHNGVTSLSNTNKAITSRVSGVQHSSISSSSAQTHAIATTPHIQGARHNAVTSSPNANEVTTRKHGTRQNPIIITSFPNTNNAIASRGSGFQYFPISSSSTHTYAIATTPRILGARHNAVTSSPKANEATTRKHWTRQNPIIITSLPHTNEATNSRELELHFPPISSLPTQTNKVFPRDPDETRHVSSIIN